MIDPSQLRRTASVSNTSFGTIDPTSLFNDRWSHADEERNITAPSPPDHMVAAGSAMSRGKQLIPETEPTHYDPKTPLRKGRGQSISNASLSGIVTPQSVNRSFSASSLAFTPGPGQQQPLMSPMDTPSATPSEDNFENFFDSTSEPKMNWNFQFDLAQGKIPDTMFSADTSSNGGQSDFSGIGNSMLQESSFSAPDAYSDPKSVYNARSSSVLSSLDGSCEDYDNFGRSMSVNSMNSPPYSSRTSRSASLNRIPYSVDAASGSLRHHHHQSRAQIGGSVSPAAVPSTSAGVNPFYNPPSFLRRTRSEVCNITEVTNSAQWSLRSSTDAGVGVFDFSNHKQVPHPEKTTHNDKKSDTPTVATVTAATAEEDPAASIVVPDGLDALENISAEHKPIKTKEHLSRAESTTSCSTLPAPSEEKPYTCETCDKSFRRMEHLRRHMKTHTMERPYPCTVPGCERRFSRTDNLKAHILTHAKKTGRNIYVEGLAERHDIKPIKRRKSRKSSTSEISV